MACVECLEQKLSSANTQKGKRACFGFDGDFVIRDVSSTRHGEKFVSSHYFSFFLKGSWNISHSKCLSETLSIESIKLLQST